MVIYITVDEYSRTVLFKYPGHWSVTSLRKPLLRPLVMRSPVIFCWRGATRTVGATAASSRQETRGDGGHLHNLGKHRMHRRSC